jgi:hypothetical protein
VATDDDEEMIPFGGDDEEGQQMLVEDGYQIPVSQNIETIYIASLSRSSPHSEGLSSTLDGSLCDQDIDSKETQRYTNQTPSLEGKNEN